MRLSYITAKSQKELFLIQRLRKNTDASVTLAMCIIAGLMNLNRCNITTLKNEMEAKEDGNIKQESIGSGKSDC